MNNTFGRSRWCLGLLLALALACGGGGGGSNSGGGTSVPIAPSITAFTAASPTITNGTATTLIPVFANGSGTVDNGIGAVTRGTLVSTGNLTATTTFTLTVTNTAGAFTTASVTVFIANTPFITAPATAQAGATGLIASVPALAGSIYSWFLPHSSDATITGGAATNQVTFAAGASGWFELNCAVWAPGAASVTGTADISVVSDTRSLITAPANALAGATGLIASVPTQANCAYEWSISGSSDATITSGTTANQITFNAGTVSGFELHCNETFTDGTFSYAVVIINLVAPPSGSLPIINSFTASPTSINSGQSTTLSWAVSGATSLSINQGVGTVTGTSTTVSPTATTTYTLTATNATGSVTATATVTLQTVPVPVINSFTVSPTSVPDGVGAILAWTVSGASSLSINNGLGTVTGATGTANISPTVTTTYTLSATNSSGTVTATATVTVTAPVIGSFTANPAAIATGASSTLSWTVSGATTLSINQGVGTVTGTSKTVSPTATTTYTLTATNATGNTTATATVTVTPSAPTISSFTANPTSITSGQSSTLSWAVTGATSLSINQGVGTVTGTSKTVSPTATTTYTLTATNASGNTTATATVLVQTVLTFTLPTAIPLEVVSIPSGSFLMGAPAEEKDASGTEMPQHQVTISRSFYMAKFLTTQAQWMALMGNNPSYFSVANGGSSTDNLWRPVEGVSWNDITKSTSYYMSFIDALNAATATTRPTGMTFRLPTEAEWEYACRAGTTTRFYWGDDLSYTDIAINAWYSQNSNSSTQPVGKMTENAFGLYDMSGNVWECCEDWYGPYTAASETDPTGPATGAVRTARGGSWISSSGVYCRSAYRYWSTAPSNAMNNFGFRVVLAAPL